MARIVGGISTSHIPAIGNAIAKGLQQEPYWKPFFDGYPRSATLEAVTDVEVVRIDLAAFDRLHEHEPAIAGLMLRDLARILALRLRLASAVIADLRGS